MKLFQRLPPKIATVNQKQNATSPRMLYETVDEIAGRVRFAAAAGRLDERAWPTLGLRKFPGCVSP
jgi:hypothetical protein